MAFASSRVRTAVVQSPFSDIDQIVAEANSTEYGLAAGVWTSDIGKAHRVAHKLRAGTVWINCDNVFDAALAFGGYKQSGWGREIGHEVLELYTEVKAICAAIQQECGTVALRQSDSTAFSFLFCRSVTLRSTRVIQVIQPAPQSYP